MQELGGLAGALLGSQFLYEQHVFRLVVKLKQTTLETHVQPLMGKGVPENAKTDEAFPIVAVLV